MRSTETKTVYCATGYRGGLGGRAAYIQSDVCATHFCLYFTDHLPEDWHDIAENHNFDFDLQLRRELVDNGIYFFPSPVKQCSISFAHTLADIQNTLVNVETAIARCGKKVEAAR